VGLKQQFARTAHSSRVFGVRVYFAFLQVTADDILIESSNSPFASTSYWENPMGPFRLMFLAAFVLVVPPMGIAFPDRKPDSNNKGKIEGTKWSSVEGTVKGVKLAAGTLKLEFSKDGKMAYDILILAKRLTGTYTLGGGDKVILNLDEQLAASKTHEESVTIRNNILTMTDTDGTRLDFEKQE
jgi:hypothetical protein